MSTQHICRAVGFGLRDGDICPACDIQRLISSHMFWLEGEEQEIVRLKTALRNAELLAKGRRIYIEYLEECQSNGKNITDLLDSVFLDNSPITAQTKKINFTQDIVVDKEKLKEVQDQLEDFFKQNGDII